MYSGFIAQALCPKCLTSSSLGGGSGMGMSSGARREVRSVTLRESSCTELTVRDCPASSRPPESQPSPHTSYPPSSSQPRLRLGTILMFPVHYSQLFSAVGAQLLARESGWRGEGPWVGTEEVHSTHLQELTQVYDFLRQKSVEEFLSLRVMFQG